MKLNIFLTIAFFAVLPLVLSACKPNEAEITRAQMELKDVKAALENTQADLKKMEADMNGVQSERDSLKSSLEKTKAELTSITRAYDRLQQQSGAIEKELEGARAELAAAARKRDELLEKVRLLTKEKNDVITMIASAAPADIPKLQEEIKKNPAKPLQNAALAAKLQEAESYVQAGNWQAAERLFLEIQAVDPAYPGLDALNSRIQNMKTLLKK
jgi:chromosome segregation ATPase